MYGGEGRGGEEREGRLHLNERAQPPLCIAADVQLREWRDLMRASLSSLSLSLPVLD